MSTSIFYFLDFFLLDFFEDLVEVFVEELFDKDALDDLYLLYNIKYIFFILFVMYTIDYNYT